MEITLAGDPSAWLLAEDVEFPSGDSTLVSIGESGTAADDVTLEFVVLEDDNSDPEEGNARVRVFHASPDTPNVDVTTATTGDVLFEDVSYGEEDYTEVAAGDFRICVYTASDHDEAVGAVNIELEEGTVYSLFATGYLEQEAEPLLNLLLPTDNVAPGDPRL